MVDLLNLLSHSHPNYKPTQSCSESLSEHLKENRASGEVHGFRHSLTSQDFHPILKTTLVFKVIFICSTSFKPVKIAAISKELMVNFVDPLHLKMKVNAFCLFDFKSTEQKKGEFLLDAFYEPDVNERL